MSYRSIALAVLALPVSANAQCSDWSPDFAPSGASDRIDAIHVHDAGDGEGLGLFAAGRFGAVNETVALGVARWNGTGWSALAGGIEVSERLSVNELHSLDYGSGHRLVALGSFEVVDGSPANGVATWDGTQWSNLGGGPPANAGERVSIADAVVFDSGNGPELWVGGKLTSIDFEFVDRPYLARYDGATWTQVTAGPNAPYCDFFDYSCQFFEIDALCIYDDGNGAQLYVSGQFDRIGAGVAATTLVRFDGTTWSMPAGIGPGGITGVANSMLVHDDGNGAKLILQGGFASAPHNRVIAYDGQNFTSLGAGPTTHVTTMNPLRAAAGRPAGLWVSSNRADFTTGLLDMSVWNGTSWTVHTMPLGYPADIFDFTDYDSGNGRELVMSGTFSRPIDGVASAHIARWDGAAWNSLGDGGEGIAGLFSSGEGFVQALEVHDDGSGPALYLGGEIVRSGGQDFDNFAKWDGSTLTPIPGFNLPYLTHIADLQSFDFGQGPVIVIAGDLKIGNTNPRGLTVWDGTTLGGFSSTTTQEGVDLAVFDDGNGDDVYYANTFGVARIEGIDQASSIGFSGALRVHALCAFDDGGGEQLYVAGRFHTIAGVSANNIVRWDGQTWTAVGNGLGEAAFGGGEVQALAVWDDGTGAKLYAGGTFTASGGLPMHGLARWNGSTWREVGGGLEGPDLRVHALEVFDDGRGDGPVLYVGGAGFENLGGPSGRALARYDGTYLDPVGLDVDGPTPVVRALAAADFPGLDTNVLAIGGDFDALGGVASQRFGVLAACETVGTPICLGDGTGALCPCSNESALGAGEGCLNSQGHGAVLHATGTRSVAADDLQLLVSGARPNQPGVLIQGGSQIASPFRDGILCTGTPTERLELLFTDAAGAGTSASSIVTEGAVSIGDTRVYQCWYRDPQLSPCATGSNFSSALSIDWN